MINSIITGLFNFVINLISVILAPIDSALNTLLPSFSDVLTSFGNFIDSILTIIPWVLSWFNVPVALLQCVCGYLIAKTTISLAIHQFKIALAWYRMLMP